MLQQGQQNSTKWNRDKKQKLKYVQKFADQNNCKFNIPSIFHLKKIASEDAEKH